ncbi:PKD domain-containing protein [Streptomyces sp. SHP 1-2]|uniref:PKD domain-containing protein n=1 Tax=Streptomyces sp. SHP 1-2 TaxID=2769489 RepID=UPI0022371ABA|nr:PKD domain-containing protein [Streptomyces sp. SHP 1-2]MCW5250372.1 PKD domain-containing protein [Streptomyces sp. SHP 1-2]
MRTTLARRGLGAVLPLALAWALGAAVLAAPADARADTRSDAAAAPAAATGGTDRARTGAGQPAVSLIPPLRVGVAETADHYDRANCSANGTCDLQGRLSGAVPQVTYACGSGVTLRARRMTAAGLSSGCGSPRARDAYSHGAARDGGPVAGDRDSAIGTRYDADRPVRPVRCAAGDCGGSTNPPVNQPPVAAFDVTSLGLTATFTDRSTDADGGVVSRSWDFGDGTTSTAANPVKTYPTGRTFTVRLTVTDERGATGTVTRPVTIGADNGTVAECRDPDTRVLGRDCRRGDRSARSGELDHLYLFVPSGVDRLTIVTNGGGGDADLYYSSTGWATPASHTARATGSGSAHTLTVTGLQPGYHYIGLYGVTDFGGVSVITRY